MISKVRGTQDILDTRLFNFVIQTAKKHLDLHGFAEIVLPILEHTELFKRSLGLHTDVVSKEMFIIANADADTEESICLRPEATASTMRAFVEHRTNLQTPWKVFTWGPMFRYERPQKGRFRQFNQINIEIIDAVSISYDVYLIAMLDRLFQERFLLENFALTINFLGCPADRQAYKKVLFDFLSSIESQLCSNCIERKQKNIMRVFDCKQSSCQALYTKAPFIADHLCSTCNAEWQQLKMQLELLSVSYSYVPTLVRGLDYYDKTVFEFVSDSLGAQKAFCSGGRYDHLASQLGSDQEYPSLGASIGMERLLLLLEPMQDKLSLSQLLPLQVVIPLDVKQHRLALLLADELTLNGIHCDIFFDGSLKSMMRKANKMGAQHVLLIGDEEQASGTVTIKNMMTGTEEKINQIDLVNHIKKYRRV
jgi:histidyl-tRNA synthetase